MPNTKNYKEYLNSPEWKQFRLEQLQKAKFKCVVCADNGLLNVHHRTYDVLGRESSSDCAVLCPQCHAKHHDKFIGNNSLLDQIELQRQYTREFKRERNALQSGILAAKRCLKDNELQTAYSILYEFANLFSTTGGSTDYPDILFKDVWKSS